MTTTSPLEPWDDERLAAAFAARASRSGTPDGLAGTVGAALRTRPSSAIDRRRLLAPAAVVILAIGAVGWGLALRGSSGVVEATASPTPETNASAPVSWAGREAMGVPIISVNDAIAIRVAGVDDREIAVHGWIAPVVHVPCPYTPATSPVQPVCPDDQIVLMADPESLVTQNGNGYSRGSPTGAHFQIDLDDLDGGWQRGLPIAASTPPVEIAVVGHFDDRRSTACPAEVVTACRDRFVVDRVDWANGEAQATSLVDFVAGAGRPFEEAQTIIDVVRPGVTILSAVHVAGDIDLPRIEPTVADRRGGLVQERALWIVRVLDAGALVTYLFVDSTGDLYDLTPDGPRIIAPIVSGETGPPPSSVTTVLGIPVITVPELISRRIGGGSPAPDEVAVRGWMIRSNVIADCATDPDPHPLVPWCQSPIFLMERPERARTLTTDGPSIVPVLGPDANLEVGIPWQEPVGVIAIGHLGDHRWQTCPLTEQETCRRQFVVDRIVAADAAVTGLPTPWRTPSGPKPDRDPGRVLQSLEGAVGDVEVISIGVIGEDHLPDIEPITEPTGDTFGVWVVRALVRAGPDPTVARTFLLPDTRRLASVEGIVSEVTDTGVVRLPPTVPSPSPWPPAGASVVELRSQVGAGRPPVRVAVSDKSGMLTAVGEARSSDPPFPGATEEGRVFVASDGGNVVRLLWIGTVCDARVTVTIEDDVAAITVDGGTRPACDAMGVDRELVLTFASAVDPSSIDATYVENVIYE